MAKSDRGSVPDAAGGKGPLAKDRDLEAARQRPRGSFLTTDQGLRVSQTDDSLKAGPRGPSILEDFHLREKLTRFDHERIPERVVHARGSGAHGYFQVYESLKRWTRAGFLCDPAIKTPVFARFSTVAGSRGSADTVRDVRGFAVKFYTQEGNFDLVGNNMPIFFIQDGMKFPDLVHAVKPEPRDEIPQASSAHDTFWDFVSLTPETTHMIFWLMSDRAIPRSLRMMEGFGVHTFRLVTEDGTGRLCKFHWKPVLGLHSLVWDEAQLLTGRDPDFHRRDLWEAIEAGQPAQWELGLQIVEEADALRYGFDMLDPTKLLPEEVVPVERVGLLTLNRNPDNFFAETEQVAFHVGNVVPGIDFTNDPLLQARLFSYLDTQLTRLGGPNFAQLPINRPVVSVHNHQQDGSGQHSVPTSAAQYHPNTVGGGEPRLTPPSQGGYAHYAERVDGKKTQARSDSFSDHFGQARLFLDSQSEPERAHLHRAFCFELGKVKRPEIRQRVLDLIAKVDAGLAGEIASEVGAKSTATRVRHEVASSKSPALSIHRDPRGSIRTRRVAVLVAGGVRGAEVRALEAALKAEGAGLDVIASDLGTVAADDGPLEVAKTYRTAASVCYDAIFVPAGAESNAALLGLPAAVRFVEEAYRHLKTIGISADAQGLLAAAVRAPPLDGKRPGAAAAAGVVIGRAHGDPKAFAEAFVDAMRLHRHFEREDAGDARGDAGRAANAPVTPTSGRPVKRPRAK